MISKMDPVEDKGARLAIVFNGSPLFTGAAGSGESEIRRWILENDWLEGIVALPDQLFYNTGISTYFWILSNRKAEALRGKVILLDARDQWEKMRKSLGDKRKQISADQIKHITELYMNALAVAADAEHPDHGKVKIFATRDFGYHRITVERPLKLRFEITEDTLAALDVEAAGEVGRRDVFVSVCAACSARCGGRRRRPRTPCTRPPGPAARLAEHGVVSEGDWAAVAVADPEGEVQKSKDGSPCRTRTCATTRTSRWTRTSTPTSPARSAHVPDAWIDHSKTKVGYEIPFTRHFYVYTPPRPLAEIDAELRDLEPQIQKLLGEVTR